MTKMDEDTMDAVLEQQQRQRRRQGKVCLYVGNRADG